jgi:hypothetical protein
MPTQVRAVHDLLKVYTRLSIQYQKEKKEILGLSFADLFPVKRSDILSIGGGKNSSPFCNPISSHEESSSVFFVGLHP